MGVVKHGMHKTPVYIVWESMIQRCTNPKKDGWEQYGGRGITVCDAWRMFENFYSDMGDRPEGHQLERNDNDAGYCRENCRWIPAIDQQNNKQNSLYVVLHGERMTAAQAARKIGMNPKTLRYRIYNNHPDIFAPTRAFNGRNMK
jgi:hypothetical protein